VLRQIVVDHDPAGFCGGSLLDADIRLVVEITARRHRRAARLVSSDFENIDTYRILELIEQPGAARKPTNLVNLVSQGLCFDTRWGGGQRLLGASRPQKSVVLQSSKNDPADADQGGRNA